MDLMEKQRQRIASLKPYPEFPEEYDPVAKEEFEKLLSGVVNTAKRTQGKAEDLQRTFCLSDEEYYNDIRRFLIVYEQGLSYAKNLIRYRQAFLTHEPRLTPIEVKGTSFSFPVSLTRWEDGYRYVLPPMQNKGTMEKTRGEGQLLHYTMLLLQQKFLKDESVSLLKNPVIIFVHYIQMDAHDIFVPDFDNLDVKTAIDELQNFLIADDSMRDITLMQFSKDDRESFTELYVLPMENFDSWLTKNKDLLKKRVEK